MNDSPWASNASSNSEGDQLPLINNVMYGDLESVRAVLSVSSCPVMGMSAFWAWLGGEVEWGRNGWVGLGVAWSSW